VISWGPNFPASESCLTAQMGRLQAWPELFRSLERKVRSHVRFAGWPPHQAGSGRLSSSSRGFCQKRVLEEQVALGVAFEGDATVPSLSAVPDEIVNCDGVLLAVARLSETQGN